MQGLYAYYWAGSDQDKPWFFLMCVPFPNGKLHRCEGDYFLEEAKSLVVLSFPADLLGDWKEIIKKTNQLVISSFNK